MGSKKTVDIAGLAIGGHNPVRVESMLKVPLTDPEKCLEELTRLSEAGCELVRVAFPDAKLKDQFRFVAEKSPVTLMADIHFDYRLALLALESGVPSIRINPGNIENKEGVRSVVSMAEECNAVIRIGANAGSINNRQIKEASGDKVLALFNAVSEQVHILEDQNYTNIIVSAKSSSVVETLRVNSLLSHTYSYPLHVGITEAGGGLSGVVKGALGIGTILSSGIGDTIRVSLTEDPIKEVKTAFEILKALEIRTHGYNLISCPTCGRRRIDVMSLAEIVRSIIPDGACEGKTIAVMGCEVNGPREASYADYGVAGAPDGILMFEKGKSVGKVSNEAFPAEFKKLLNI